MKYIQVGEIGKAVLVPTKSDLPTAGIAYLNKFYVATDKNIVYTCKPEGSGYAWKVATILPALTNGIATPIQLQEGVEAIDADGNKVTGTMKFVEKTANANGTYLPSEDGAQGYSKFIVDVAGETAQNPYIATTEAEMKAYLAEEYVGSFVKYKTPLYFNQASSVPLQCISPNPTLYAIDTGLGPEYVNMKIDEWLPEPGMVKIASIETFNHDNTFGGVSQPYSIRETFDLYAWKYKNADGSYTRVLFYAFAQTWAFSYNPDSSASWGNNAAGGIAFYQDNITDEAKTALGQLSISVTAGDYTGTTDVGVAPAEYKDYVKLGFFSYAVPNHNNYTDYYGKYASEDSDAKAGIMGVAQLSWATDKSVYWNSITYPRCTYLYKDASVLLGCVQWSYNQKLESEKTYRDGFVYIVNSKKATRNKWQAESPLVQGDQLAGATLYFNQQITLKEFDDLCNSMIADSETDGGDYYLYNVDNPYTTEDMYAMIANSCPLVVAHDGGLMSYLNFAEGSESNIYLFDYNNDNSTIKYASIVAPSSITAEGNTIAIPATVGKVNKPDISNAVIGKTANFTSSVEEYSVYYFTQEVVPGNVFTVSNTVKMDALLGDDTTNNEIAKNRVYLFTGQDGKYVQGTFYQLSNGSLHILPPLDVEDTALIPVYFETQEGWYHSPSGTSVKQLIQLISRGMYAVCPEPPSVAIGKSFDAWYTQPTGGTEWNFSTAINEPTILYAQYIQ